MSAAAWTKTIFSSRPAAYAQFPEVNFVIHTHQGCASALGLAGFDAMDITPEERAALGGWPRPNTACPAPKS